MPEERPLTPATPAELEQTLAHALRFDGRKRIHRGDAFMAELMAQHLAQYLAQSGFVVMKKPPGRMATSGDYGMASPGVGPYVPPKPGDQK